MSVNNNVVYTKDGATFASGAEAYADKNSLYSPELQSAVSDCYAQMLTDGILLEPVSQNWDQATYTLTVIKVVTSVEAYKAAITFNIAETVVDAAAAGWTYIRSTTI